jgi:hypothetical protein
MATCPNCKTRNTTMSITTTGHLITRQNPFSLAGEQTKFLASAEHELTCDPDLGGCGWSITGYIENGYLVARRADVKGP